ncbi:unnamed protein product [Rotaria magnacalcarata]|uniref:Uncharacterized protein n=1 Tax=Rotaria magnacalcarata TaxID=392030 RepID=A0A819UPT7_9BILA|nr:unnamed protein product [Rotaria magnacalcarata]CAF4098790.1 unnamed protein product [Rotaria magnacalcarata]
MNSTNDFNGVVADLKLYTLQHSRYLEEKLFSRWMHREMTKTLKYFPRHKNLKGIVICTGNGHFLLTLVALRALQSTGNTMPIEIMFSTSADLSLSNQKMLAHQFPEVRLVDLSTIFNDSYLELRGWEIKPFAVLASRFQQVLLIDADVLFLEKPSVLFENELYLRTGSLFFYDRPDLSPQALRWIRSISKKSIDTIPKRTQESGVVLIDKGRTLLGLLSTCKLNEHDQRERVTYRHLYGDKDTWWLGFHLVDMVYSFIPTLTASIGYIQHHKVCGHILHLDQKHQPIWWNGGMFKNRYVNTRDILPIEVWLEEGTWTLATYSCLINHRQNPRSFNQYQRHLIENYTQITKYVYNIS